MFDTAAVAPPMAPGTAPPDALAERSMALRASRSRSAEVDAAQAAETARLLAAAKARAEASRRAAADTMAQGQAPSTGGDFWRRLANCESSTGTGGNGGGYFQFSPDTARKVGYRPGMSYEQQVALAQKWLAMIGGRGGSRSGWPHCWWVAGGG